QSVAITRFAVYFTLMCFFFSSRRRHTRSKRDWSSDVCSSDLKQKLRHRFCLRRSLFFCAPPPRLDRAFPFVKLLQLVRHQVLHALALCAGVIVAIAFQQVDDTPNTETGTQSDDQSLKHFDSRVKEIHSHFLLRKRACGRSVHT